MRSCYERVSETVHGVGVSLCVVLVLWACGCVEASAVGVCSCVGRGAAGVCRLAVGGGVPMGDREDWGCVQVGDREELSEDGNT